ncbi:hypothetical protein BXZ70DRAFT_1073969 [Cristinia sonorae]|uniref:DUF6533 domain-containing protein n=1 Tax=Cristinia sonorae TaxID=1940300 RepID=A0A8K0XJV9_9AGAR|nr:hypothetical protein BXZ70DRAFT_1073969 [Cristinia sonorae]
MLTTVTPEAIKLLKAGKIPMFTCVTSLTWVLYDYFLTVEDEIRYIWPNSWNFGKIMFFWVRYYTILVTLFDVAQIHSFATFQPSLTTCVAMDSTIRMVGAISLWSIEIVMQLRIYALYRGSKKVALVNGFLFLVSIVGFFYILVFNAERRADVIRDAKKLPIPGCPSIHTGIEYAQWIPATAFEGVLFGFALFQSLRSLSNTWRESGVKFITLYPLIVRDNLLYFFGVSCLLLFNNLMVVNVTHIPWFSYGPFHAAVGIMTVRMLLHLQKAFVMQSRMVAADAPTTGPTAPSINPSTVIWRSVTTVGGGGRDTEHYDLEAYPSPVSSVEKEKLKQTLAQTHGSSAAIATLTGFIFAPVNFQETEHES